MQFHYKLSYAEASGLLSMNYFRVETDWHTGSTWPVDGYKSKISKITIFQSGEDGSIRNLVETLKWMAFQLSVKKSSAQHPCGQILR